MFDAAGHLLVIDIVNGAEVSRNQLVLDEADLLPRATRVAGLGVDVLVCGAISRPLEAMLVSAGVRVIGGKCGLVEEVLRVFMSQGLSEEAFVMPGFGRCRGRKRGRRHGGGEPFRRQGGSQCR